MLKQKINTDYLTAFKSGDKMKKNLLSVVKGDIQTIEKNINTENLSDLEVTKILSKIAKGLKEINNEESNLQLSIIESYLPKELSYDEIYKIVKTLKGGGITKMSEIMEHFKSIPADKKTVASIFNTLI